MSFFIFSFIEIILNNLSHIEHLQVYNTPSLLKKCIKDYSLTSFNKNINFFSKHRFTFASNFKSF